MYPIHRELVPAVIDRKWHSSHPIVISPRHNYHSNHLGKPNGSLGSSSSLTSRSLCDADDDADEDDEFFTENIHNTDGVVRPPVPRSDIKLGYPFLACSCPSPMEQWKALYRHFHSPKKDSKVSVDKDTPCAAPPPPQARQPPTGTLSQLATKMFSDCTRVMQYRHGAVVSDEWVEYREVPLQEGFPSVRPQFWKDYQQEEQCRVYLTE